MMNLFIRKHKQIDFEKLGYEMMLQSRGDEELARNICGLAIHAAADELHPAILRLQSEIAEHRRHGAALHAHLYDRPEPVNDATMLTHSRKVRRLRLLAALAAVACLAGNVTTFYLFGFDPFITLLLAAGATGLPLVVGHAAYEQIVVKHRKLQIAVILLAVALSAMGLLRLAEARQLMVGKAAAAAAPATGSSVDETPTEPPVAQDQNAPDGSEAKVREALGGAMLCIMIAADLMLGFLVGRLGHMNTQEDYAAWQELRETQKLVIKLEETVSELNAFIEIAKKRCAQGILRAKNVQNNRKPPYHGPLVVFFCFVLLSLGTARAQTIDHYEGILIDVSGSIGKGGATNDLLREYLTSTRNLLLSEPAKSRVWVSSISTDSFGGWPSLLHCFSPYDKVGCPILADKPCPLLFRLRSKSGIR
jgi:hypothetical protein